MLSPGSDVGCNCWVRWKLYFNCRRSCPPPAPAHALRIPRHCCRLALGQLPGTWGSRFTSGHTSPPAPVPAPDTHSSHGCLWKRHLAAGEVHTGTRWSQARSGRTPDHTGDCAHDSLLELPRGQMEQDQAGGKHSLRWEPASVGFLQKTEATAPGTRPPTSAVSRPVHTQRARTLYSLGTLFPDHTPGHEIGRAPRLNSSH